MNLSTLSFVLYFFTIFLLIIYIINYLIDYNKIKKKKFDNIMIMSYVVKKFKINKNDIDYKKELKIMSLINSFIISFVGTVVSCINSFIFIQLGIGFVLLFLLIYALYEIYGRHLVKKIGRNK